MPVTSLLLHLGWGLDACGQQVAHLVRVSKLLQNISMICDLWP